jgi:gas vesicle protein
MKLMRTLFIAGIGAAVGMLLAPKPGKDLRRELEERFGSLIPGTGLLSSGDTGRTYAEESSESLQAKIEATRRRLQEQGEGPSGV